MKITTVTYKRLVSTERFGNVSVEATGSLDASEDRDEAFDELRRWVDLQVMTRKHAIEGRLSDDDDDDEPPAQVWPQVPPQPPRAQQFQQGRAPATVQLGGVATISASQITGPGGQVLAQARGLPSQQATPRNYALLGRPPGGKVELETMPQGTGVLTVHDAQGAMQGAPLFVDQHTARSMLDDAMQGEILTSGGGEVAYTPSPFLADPPPPANGWLQVVKGYACDFLEYRNWDGRIKRAMPPGWAQAAMSRGLLVPRQGQAGMIFGATEGAFWAAMPPTLFDDAEDDDERPEDEAFAADWDADAPGQAGGVMCPDCMGSGSEDIGMGIPKSCTRCAGSGSIEPLAMVV